MRRPRPFLAALALYALSTLAPGVQAPALPQLDTSGVAVRCDERETLVSAESYAASFRDGATRVSARVTDGLRAPDLGLRLESIRRGGELVFAAGAGPAPAPELEGTEVRFAWPGFDELLEARPLGLKQSFVFESAPTGRGELVARLALDTELVPRAVGTESIAFEHAGREVLEIGVVLGVDATGRSARGELRLGARTLDLVLPADFVDGASYPLVLDPLITFRAVPGSSDGDFAPDVAWDAETNRFCITWVRSYGAQLVFLAQLFEASGDPVGAAIFIGATPSLTTAEPAVCNLNASDVFVLAHRTHPGPVGGTVLVTALSAHDGRLHQETLSVPRVADLDVGGDPTEEFASACLVWSVVGGDIEARLVKVASVDELELGAVLRIDQGGAFDARHPRISQSNGPAGRWLVVWDVIFPTNIVPFFRSIDAFGELGDAGTASTPGWRPSCDGDGEHFLIAYEGKSGGENLLYGELVDVDGGTVSHLQHRVLLASQLAIREPEVAILLDGSTYHNAYAVAWILDYTARASQYQVFREPGLEPLGATTDVTIDTHRHRLGSRFAADFGFDGYDTFAIAVGRYDAIRYGVAVP